MKFDGISDVPGLAIGRDDNIAHRAIVGYFVPWDLSKKPTQNDLEAKLGLGTSSTHAMAVYAVDEANNATVYVDGFQGKPLTSLRLFNPDSWMLRLYSAMGTDWPALWEPRLVVEHRNKAQERTHRSTMLIDACTQQTWAWLQDLLWIKNLSATCDHEELRINGAGFPTILYPDTPSGTITRGALMLNIARNAGWVTDGVMAGPLAHVLHIFGSPGTQSGGTDTCSDVTKSYVGLRGDVNFHMGGGIAHLAIGPGALTEGDPYGGNLWIGPPSPSPPATELATDASSNQPTQSRQSPQGIRPVVYKPKEWSPIRPPYDVPPDYPAAVPTTRPPVASGGSGAFSPTTWAGGGVVTGTSTVADIPETVPDGFGVDFSVNFIVPVGAAVDAVVMQFDYATMANGDSASPGALTGSLVDSIATGTAGNLDRMIFTVPTSALKGKEGGKLAIALYRRGDLEGHGGNPNPLQVISINTHFGVPVVTP